MIELHSVPVSQGQIAGYRIGEEQSAGVGTTIPSVVGWWNRCSLLTSAGPIARHQPGCSSRSARLHPLVPRTDSSFVIFPLKRIIKYLVDSWVQGIVRMAVIADINQDRNAAMNVTFVAPLPKSDVSLLSDDVTFPT